MRPIRISFTAILAAGLLTAVAAFGESDSALQAGWMAGAEECEAHWAHWFEMQLAMPSVTDAQRQEFRSRKEEILQPRVRGCVGNITQVEFRCSQSAGSPEALSACYEAANAERVASARLTVVDFLASLCPNKTTDACFAELNVPVSSSQGTAAFLGVTADLIACDLGIPQFCERAAKKALVGNGMAPSHEYAEWGYGRACSSYLQDGGEEPDTVASACETGKLLGMGHYDSSGSYVPGLRGEADLGLAPRSQWTDSTLSGHSFVLLLAGLPGKALESSSLVVARGGGSAPWIQGNHALALTLNERTDEALEILMKFGHQTAFADGARTLWQVVQEDLALLTRVYPGHAGLARLSAAASARSGDSPPGDQMPPTPQTELRRRAPMCLKPWPGLWPHKHFAEHGIGFGRLERGHQMGEASLVRLVLDESCTPGRFGAPGDEFNLLDDDTIAEVCASADGPLHVWWSDGVLAGCRLPDAAVPELSPEPSGRDPEAVRVVWDRAAALLSKGEPDRAADVLVTELEGEFFGGHQLTDRTSALDLLGDRKLREGSWAEARRLYSRSLELRELLPPRFEARVVGLAAEAPRFSGASAHNYGCSDGEHGTPLLDVLSAQSVCPDDQFSLDYYNTKSSLRKSIVEPGECLADLFVLGGVVRYRMPAERCMPTDRLYLVNVALDENPQDPDLLELRSALEKIEMLTLGSMATFESSIRGAPPPEHHPSVIASHTRLARLEFAAGNADQVERHINAVKQSVFDYVGTDHPANVSLHASRGYFGPGQAVQFFSFAGTALPEEHPGLFPFYVDYALDKSTHCDQPTVDRLACGRQALVRAMHALSIAETYRGIGSGDWTKAISTLGQVLLNLKFIPASIPAHLKAATSPLADGFEADVDASYLIAVTGLSAFGGSNSEVRALSDKWLQSAESRLSKRLDSSSEREFLDSFRVASAKNTAFDSFMTQHQAEPMESYSALLRWQGLASYAWTRKRALLREKLNRNQKRSLQRLQDLWSQIAVIALNPRFGWTGHPLEERGHPGKSGARNLHELAKLWSLGLGEGNPFGRLLMVPDGDSWRWREGGVPGPFGLMCPGVDESPLSCMVVGGLTTVRHEKLAELHEEVDRLEAQLSAEVAAGGNGWFAARPTAQTVCEALPEGSALVDYRTTRIQLLDMRTGEELTSPALPSPVHKHIQRVKAQIREKAVQGDAPLAEGFLLVGNGATKAEQEELAALSGRQVDAFVLKSGQCDQVQRVHLGSARELGYLVQDYRTKISSLALRDRAVDHFGGLVRQSLWDPVAAHLGDRKEVFVVLDGVVSSVPFSALPLEGGRYLVEDFTLRHLQSPGDLLELSSPPKKYGKGLLALGDVSYGGDEQSGEESQTRAAPCVDGQFKHLAGTKSELEFVLERARRRGLKSTRLAGNRATEASVTRAVQKARYVHLATHGFFASGNCRESLATVPLQFYLFEVDDWVAFNFGPMLQSGLVLSGANDRYSRSPQKPDGLWTAAEVSTLDLSGVETVVLSACETGLGEVQTGEGVLGLQRAFRAAGARTLIMSLWAVDDEATRALMESLYDKLLDKDPMAASDALRHAQLAVLEANRAEGQAKPGSWGAFFASGDWK